MAIKEVCWIPKTRKDEIIGENSLVFFFFQMLKSFPFEQSNCNKWDELNGWKCIIVVGLFLIFIHILNISAQNFMNIGFILTKDCFLLAPILRQFETFFEFLFVVIYLQIDPKLSNVFKTYPKFPKLCQIDLNFIL